MFPGSYFIASYFAPGYWSGTGEVEIIEAVIEWLIIPRRRRRH